MNKSVSKVFDEYQELSSQAKHPSEYTVLKHDNNEVTGIPVEPNLLFFTNKDMQEKYFKTLYVDQSTRSISKEFSYNLITFYIFLTLMMLINLISSLFLFNFSEISKNFMIFHLVCTSTIIFLSYLLLFLLINFHKILKINRLLFCILGSVVFLYLILGSSQVFQGITGDDCRSHLFPTVVEIVGFTYSYRRVLFDSYRHLVLTLIPVLIILLVLLLTYSHDPFFTVLSEFAAVSLFVVSQIVEINIVENRTIQLFYRMEKEESGHEINLKKNKGKEDYFESENKNSLAKSLEKKCDFVISELKYAASVIIFKDVKTRLKKAQSELLKIKSKIEKITSDTNFEIVTHDLDAEDKEFIAQNFLKVSTIGRPNSNKRKTRNLNSSSKLIQTLSILSGLHDYLSKLGKDWNLNIFYIQEKTSKTISVVSAYIFSQHVLERTLKVSEETFVSFFDLVESSYKSNPYHNSAHGADVFASFYYFFLSTEIHCFCSDLDVVTFTIAALGHDVGHPGLTNRFLVTSRDKLAIQYNDSSILENMHCAILFSLMSQGFDVMAEIEDEEWISCRKMIINMILDTDLSKHFEICSRFKGRVLVNEQEKMVIENLEDKNLIFSMGLKCADIGHSAKAKELHLKWTTLVMEEFFIQGDIEKQLALSVSIYCDRNNTDIAKSQAGFIRNICIPIFETWTTFVKSESVDSCLKQLRENYLYWDDTYKNKKWISVEKLD